MALEQVHCRPLAPRISSIDPSRLMSSRNPSDTLRYNYLDNDDTALESLIAKHRKYGTSILQHTESDQELKRSSSKERPTRSRTDERSEHGGRARRSQSLVRRRTQHFPRSCVSIVERSWKSIG